MSSPTQQGLSQVMIELWRHTSMPSRRLKRFRLLKAPERWSIVYPLRLRSWKLQSLTITKVSLSCQPWMTCCHFQYTAFQWLTCTLQLVTSRWWLTTSGAISVAMNSRESYSATLMAQSDMCVMTGSLMIDFYNFLAEYSIIHILRDRLIACFKVT